MSKKERREAEGSTMAFAVCDTTPPSDGDFPKKIWLKIKSPFLWLGVFIIFFPQVEAINSPAERIWPILGTILGIIGIIMVVRVTISAARRRDTV